MAILTQDIKILKSAVMNDSTDGGGRMTGVPVVDGQSNSLFPDTSAMDRAFGRVQLRKVFGVAHTNDTDTLMGAHAIITDTPDDPNVHCTLMKTPNWGDQRNTAKEQIERYLVKGPRMSWRIYDTHYEGSAKLRLYAFADLRTPTSGESLCLINPNGDELFVRIMRVKAFAEKVFMQEGSGTVEATANFLECDLSQTLAMDIYGPPITRVGLNEQQYAMIFSTTLASGLKFYGAKPLGVEGRVGDLNVTTEGGIFTPLVPAATSEVSVVDQYPLRSRIGVSKTGFAKWTSSQGLSFTGTQKIVTPTPIEPLSFEFLGGVACTDDGAGNLMSAGVNRGSINYKTGEVVLNFGSGFNGRYAYTPASLTGASTCSAVILISSVNQGLAFTENLFPPPAPTTVSVSYLAQGRWYELTDNGFGKLSGVDTTYGSGSVNYDTGSISLTLGALPDVESGVIIEWGKLGSATQIGSASLPNKLSCFLPLVGDISQQSVKFDIGNGILIERNANGTSYNQAGFEAEYVKGGFIVKPHTITNQIVMHYQLYGAGLKGYEVGGDNVLQFVLTNTPVLKGTVKFDVNFVGTDNSDAPLVVNEPRVDVIGEVRIAACYDLNGKIYAVSDNGQIGIAPRTHQEIGTIDYQTGEVRLTKKYSVRAKIQTLKEAWTGSYVIAEDGFTGDLYDKNLNTGTFSLRTDWTFIDAWGNRRTIARTRYRKQMSQHTTSTIGSKELDISPAFETLVYGGEAGEVQTATFTPEWSMQLPAPLLINGLAAIIANDPYFGRNGVLYGDWNAVAGTGIERGSINENGKITLNMTPSLNGKSNQVTWLNAATSTISGQVDAGIFRVTHTPLKQNSLQLAVGVSEELTRALKFEVDYARGIVTWASPTPINATDLRYNTVYLEYLPLESSILGLNTARLPLDGKVPVYRSGDLCVVHNTLTLTLPNPLVKGTAYAMRERLASVRVKDALGVVVPDNKYDLDLNEGTILFPTGTSITEYAQPFTVEHRIEDLLLCSEADISGRLRFTRSLTHNFPPETSYVSSALPFGDLFARFYNVFEQQTWTNQWSDVRIGGSMTANFNETDYPIQVTNRGTIKERWAVIFTGSTAFRVVGESVGEISYGNTSADCAPTNNATSAPYFVIPALGWGSGWAAGNVLRFNTDACGAAFWIVRTILQGPASVESDKFALAFRGDVDRP
jgi:hypothetical protein